MRARHRTIPRSGQEGVTLVELITAMALLVVIAAIVISRVDVRPRAQLAVMQSDLRNLVPMQETYFAKEGEYAHSTDQLAFTTSPEVTLVMIGDQTGWSARAQHQKHTEYRCAIYIGDVTPVFDPAESEGVVECLPKKGGGKGGKGKG